MVQFFLPFFRRKSSPDRDSFFFFFPPVLCWQAQRHSTLLSSCPRDGCVWRRTQASFFLDLGFFLWVFRHQPGGTPSVPSPPPLTRSTARAEVFCLSCRSFFWRRIGIETVRFANKFLLFFSPFSCQQLRLVDTVCGYLRSLQTVLKVFFFFSAFWCNPTGVASVPVAFSW